ncbi:MAG: hypothetical protein LW711_10610 [Saprospiraceae bacterium]|nr:hypothetical protein [Saprospiraceae bacterium]
MTLIKSISGTRGTIGGRPGDNLTAIDIVVMTAASQSAGMECAKIFK